MKDEWYTPEEKMPPYGEKVLLNIKFPYIESGMHTMGWFQPDGFLKWLETEEKDD